MTRAAKYGAPSGKNILIIDDEPNLLAIMAEMLTTAGHAVTAISDGRSVVDGETGIDFDLVVTDMVMPGADGLESITYLLRRKPNLPIIAISGGGIWASSFHLELAERMGAFRTLKKPFALQDLLEFVNQALSRDEVVNDHGHNLAAKQ